VRCDAAEPAQVIGDADRLMQVVRNLVRNGVQAAGRPQGVRVTLEAGPEEHRLRVEDDGPGLDDEALARVFERGYRRGQRQRRRPHDQQGPDGTARRAHHGRIRRRRRRAFRGAAAEPGVAGRGATTTAGTRERSSEAPVCGRDRQAVVSRGG
jgi:signal transduction histidine kinase